MAKQTSPDLIPRDGVIFGCGLGILIPAVLVFVYFFITDGVVPAVDGGLFTIFYTGFFTGPLGMVIGAMLVASRRLSDEERKKAIQILVPRLGGVVGFILGFWIPALTIFTVIAWDNGENLVPGMINGLCAGTLLMPLGAAGGKYLATYLMKVWSKGKSSN